jgi:hypothetical protein
MGFLLWIASELFLLALADVKDREEQKLVR